MGSEVEIPETPNWLQELEAKRERRLKTKLGHELGAGAPCLTCLDKCAGLDLHFWRKICKNCKCCKENHEIQDDDIYGWAQDELLGKKDKRLKTKIVLPGKKDEVELDWTPNGQKETIDKYLKSLPTDLLPIKGSQAAQERKQLLKKQIPIHDIDPSLCHELTDKELQKMQEYIAHIKQSSVGVGRLIQINFNKGNTHILGNDEAMILINNVPKSLANSKNVDIQQSIRVAPLKNLMNQFEQLEILRPQQSSQHITTQEPVLYSLKNKNELRYRVPPFKNQVPSAFVPPKYIEDKNTIETSNLNMGKPAELQYPSKFIKKFPTYNSGEQKKIHNDKVEPTKIRDFKDLAYSTYENLPEGKKLPRYQSIPTNILEDDLQPTFVPIGGVRDMEYGDVRIAASQANEPIGSPQAYVVGITSTVETLPCCHHCKKQLEQDELAIAIPERAEAIFHTKCFKCCGCNQALADLFYFYDRQSDSIYCGRDYAKIRGIPRCKACDELIFVKEYCLAENSTFHVKHFCCFECDKPLAGQNYVMENDQPVCVPCYELTKANKCFACKNVIHPDQQGLQLKDGVHFHATDECFACKICKKSLFGEKLLFRKERLFCSHDCFNADVI